jgi:alkylation response protein AidB-like acyl-CoA dehydrogenase
MDFALPPAEVAYLDGVRAFVRERVAPAAAMIDQTAEFPRELVRGAAALGLAGVTLPADRGGAGHRTVLYALAIEAVAFGSATLAVSLVVHNSLVVEPILQYGSAPQHETWLRRLASGDAIGAFALSEPDAGSDAANQRTVARADGDEYVIRGVKAWVANAAAADVAVVTAVTDPSVGSRGLTAFLVPLELPGLRKTPLDSLGVRGLGCMDLTFDDVRVPATARLGAAGAGWRLAMRALEGGRVAIAAQALGVGQAALDEALAYARTRHAFGQPIGSFQAIQFQLADLVTDLDAARLLMWRAADRRDRQARAGVEAAMAKLQASEAAHRAADRAMQILASAGYRRGSTIERLFRDIRAAEIYQGTSEVQRLIIAHGIVGAEGAEAG